MNRRGFLSGVVGLVMTILLWPSRVFAAVKSKRREELTFYGPFRPKLTASPFGVAFRNNINNDEYIGCSAGPAWLCDALSDHGIISQTGFMLSWIAGYLRRSGFTVRENDGPVEDVYITDGFWSAELHIRDGEIDSNIINGITRTLAPLGVRFGWERSPDSKFITVFIEMA